MTPRVATLGSINDDDGLIEATEFPITERVRRLPQESSGGCLIYWEAQGKDRMCALHCLNTLLQGPLYTEVDLSSVALHLDAEERKLIYATSGSNQELSGLLAGESSNAADDGFFSISVLEECLKQYNVSCTPVTGAATRTVISDPTGEEAFVCNHHDHWFAVRKLWGNWYNLDSLKPAPARVGEFYMSAFLYNLIEQRYSVFVVRSTSDRALPLPNRAALIRPLNSNQFFLTDKQIDALIHMDQEFHSKAIKAEASKFGDAPLEPTTPAMSVPTEHQWPAEGGRRLAEVVPSAQDAPELALDDDPELAEALKLSMADFVNSLPHPPEEPDVGAPDALAIQIRLPDQGRLTRRFLETSAVESIFHWLEAQSSVSPHTAYQLVATFPRRTLRRIDRQTVQFVSEGRELEECAQWPLKAVFKSKQEMLMLQII